VKDAHIEQLNTIFDVLLHDCRPSVGHGCNVAKWCNIDLGC